MRQAAEGYRRGHAVAEERHNGMAIFRSLMAVLSVDAQHLVLRALIRTGNRF